MEEILQPFFFSSVALAEIRDSKLYKVFHETFEEYCKERWGWNKAYCNHIVRAAEVVRSLPEKTATMVATERQARELAKVEPEKRTEVIEKAKATADAESRPMTARDISDAARDEDEDHPHVTQCQETEVNQLTPISEHQPGNKNRSYAILRRGFSGKVTN